MKVLKLSCVAIAYLFAGGFTPKPLVTQTYYYMGDFQRIAPGHVMDVSLCDRTINCANFTDVTNWTLTPQLFIPTSDYSQYIGSITFNEESVADGGFDTQLTLQEALNAVCTQYQIPNPDAMQPCYTVDGSATVCITAANACH